MPVAQPSAMPPAAHPAPPVPARPKRGRAWLLGLAVTLVVLVGAVTVGYFAWTSSSVDPAAVETIVID